MNTIEPNAGSVILRGHKITVDSDVGRAFAVDCCRFIEGLIGEEALRKKYGLLTDASWRELSDIEPLQLLIGRLREERVRDGTAQREKAARYWLTAVDVIGAIVADPAQSAKHRLDGARELRACAVGTAEDKPDAREKFIINISFGQHRLEREVELKQIKHDEGDDEDDRPRPTGIVSYANRG
jgi:hypothetical protein